MRVAIFQFTEETFGFRSPEGRDFDLISSNYRVVDLPEIEVQELRDAFEKFQKAQNKIARLLDYETHDDRTYSDNK